jgi:hypothetical protein
MSQKTNSTDLSNGKMNPIKFHSLFENEGADQGMADLLTMEGWQEVSYELADVIIFNGGSDIGTSLYDEKPVRSGIPEKPSRRDQQEIDIYDRYNDGTKLLVGICRGAQLLNVLNGGSLWQDVDGHGRSHNMLILATNQTMYITSTHHQMMRPNLKTGKVLAVADCAHNKFSAHDTWTHKGGAFFSDDHKDTEIVWYPNTRCLCIQGHPEYVPNSEFATFCIDLISHYLEEVRVSA